MGKILRFIAIALFFSLAANTGAFADHSRKTVKTCERPLLPPSFANKTGELSEPWVRQHLREMKDNATPTEELLRNAAQDRGVAALMLNRDIIKNHNTNYTNVIKSSAIVDQFSSGRCWIEAGQNVLVPPLVAQGLVDNDFLFSDNYLYFFSTLEKANTFLANASEAVKTKANDRSALVKELSKEAFGDGGYSQWFGFLVEKYGMIPKSAMIESSGSVNTKLLGEHIETKINLVAEKMRQVVIAAETLKWPAAKLDQQLKQIHFEGLKDVMSILVAHLGIPPEEFEFRASEKLSLQEKLKIAKSPEGRLIKTTPAILTKYTPLSFARDFVKFKPEDYIVLSYNPFQPMGQLLQLEDSASAVTMNPQVRHSFTVLNLPMERLESLAMASIDRGEPIYFSSDVHDSSDFSPERSNKPYTGILHPDLYKPDAVYGFTSENSLSAPRAVLTYYKLIAPTHAMVMMGYDRPDPNAPAIKFLVMNSWGKNSGDKGFLHMYRAWLYRNVFAIVVKKDLLSEDERAAISRAPIIVPDKKW